MGEKFDLQIIPKCNIILLNTKFNNKWYIIIDIRLIIDVYVVLPCA